MVPKARDLLIRSWLVLLYICLVLSLTAALWR